MSSSETNQKGRYGQYGGQYIPETLMNAVHELEEAYEKNTTDQELTGNWMNF